MAVVYILYSEKADKFYTGSCLDLKTRMTQHASKTFVDSYTSNINDWILFYQIPSLEQTTARKIEAHIKKMKSKIYILNLKKYPEITNKLIDKYS